MKPPEPPTGLRQRPALCLRCYVLRAAEEAGVSPAAILGPQRTRRLSWPRMRAMADAYLEAGYSSPQIGRAFGGRDHTTVLHAVERRQKGEI